MAGTNARTYALRYHVHAYNSGAVTAGMTLAREVMTFRGKVGAVKVYGATAGTGTGNTELDILINKRSIWSDFANAPKLLATSTGEFTNGQPSPGLRSFVPGDVIEVRVVKVSTSGHARLAVTASKDMG